MAKLNTAQEVSTRIKELTEKKAADLAKIQKEQRDARTQIEAATLAIKDATERMDLEAYEEAKQKKEKAQTALDMYSGRYVQIEKQEYVTEEESDKVIDSLLEYERKLTADFEAAIAEPLNELARLQKAYKEEIKEAENIIRQWTGTIHANYSTRGATYRTNPVTGKLTDKADHPVAVHPLGYEGSSAASIIQEVIIKGRLTPYRKG